LRGIADEENMAGVFVHELQLKSTTYRVFRLSWQKARGGGEGHTWELQGPKGGRIGTSFPDNQGTCGVYRIKPNGVAGAPLRGVVVREEQGRLVDASPGAGLAARLLELESEKARAAALEITIKADQQRAEIARELAEAARERAQASQAALEAQRGREASAERRLTAVTEAYLAAATRLATLERELHEREGGFVH